MNPVMPGFVEDLWIFPWFFPINPLQNMGNLLVIQAGAPVMFVVLYSPLSSSIYLPSSIVNLIINQLSYLGAPPRIPFQFFIYVSWFPLDRSKDTMVP